MDNVVKVYLLPDSFTGELVEIEGKFYPDSVFGQVFKTIPTGFWRTTKTYPVQNVSATLGDAHRKMQSRIKWKIDGHTNAISKLNEQMKLWL